MLLDTDRPFQDICTAQEFRDILQDLRLGLRSREKAEVWARNLKFICQAPGYDKSQSDTDDCIESESAPDENCVCYSDWSFESDPSKDTLMVTTQKEFPDCNHYVAVSWCWNSEGEQHAAPTAPQGYYIQNAATGSKRPCTIPRDILSRAIAFASFYKVPFLWFDKECINQDDATDQELGIQSMDMVYQWSLYPLGILQSYLDEQWHLDLFHLMVEGLPITADQMPQLLELLRILEQDKWFTRAWILQEYVCGGDDMTLLIQHDPSLNKSKSAPLGPLPGEIETTLQEFQIMLFWVHNCIDSSEIPINPEVERSLRRTVDNILGFFPSVLSPPEKGFSNPDYRQTCNAAQALQYLNTRHNTVISDRIAIMGNLCDYRLRLDMSEVEKRGYGFSVCAYALAIFNGDLSLTRSENPRDIGSTSQCFSWGPQAMLRMDHLEYFESDADDIVRISPSRLVDEGLLTKGWLWQIERIIDLNLDIDSNSSDDDPVAVIWRSLKSLVRDGEYKLADVIWTFTRRGLFGGPKSIPIPNQLEKILQEHTASFIYHEEPWIKSEDDFRVLFEATPSPNDEPKMLVRLEQGRKQRWKNQEWFWRYLLEHHTLPVANICNQIDPSDQKVSSPAIFIPQLRSQEKGLSRHTTESSIGSYFFLPSTCLDSKLTETRGEILARYWRVQVEVNSQLDHRIVRGTGEMFHAFCRLPENCEPETFIFA